MLPFNLSYKSIIKAILVCFTIFIFILNEFHYVKLTSAAAVILKKVVDLDPDDDRTVNDYKFVYFRSKEISLQPLNDQDFNMVIYAAYLQRVVEYCQWDDTNGYTKGWYENEIDSSDFDPRYQNPQIQGVISKSTKGYLSCGLYIIDSSLLQINETDILIPSYEQLSHFTNSPMQYYFRYIGNGYFYKEYMQGTSPILQRHMNGLVNNELPRYALADLFNDCNPGDIRVSFRVWSPKEISVLGYREGLTIKKHSFDGVEFGKAVDKRVSKKGLLIENRIQTMVKAYSIRAFAISIGVLMYVYQRGNARNVLIVTIISIFCIFKIPDFFNNFTEHTIKTFSICIALLITLLYLYFLINFEGRRHLHGD